MDFGDRTHLSGVRVVIEVNDINIAFIMSSCFFILGPFCFCFVFPIFFSTGVVLLTWTALITLIAIYFCLTLLDSLIGLFHLLLLQCNIIEGCHYSDVNLLC